MNTRARAGVSAGTAVEIIALDFIIEKKHNGAI